MVTLEELVVGRRFVHPGGPKLRYDLSSGATLRYTHQDDNPDTSIEVPDQVWFIVESSGDPVWFPGNVLSVISRYPCSETYSDEVVDFLDG